MNTPDMRELAHSATNAIDLATGEAAFQDPRNNTLIRRAAAATVDVLFPITSHVTRRLLPDAERSSSRFLLQASYGLIPFSVDAAFFTMYATQFVNGVFNHNPELAGAVASLYVIKNMFSYLALNAIDSLARMKFPRQ